MMSSYTSCTVLRAAEAPTTAGILRAVRQAEEIMRPEYTDVVCSADLWPAVRAKFTPADLLDRTDLLGMPVYIVRDAAEADATCKRLRDCGRWPLMIVEAA